MFHHFNLCNTSKSFYYLLKVTVLKSWVGGGQDKPAGIGCPPTVIEGILSD